MCETTYVVMAHFERKARRREGGREGGRERGREGGLT